MNKLSFFSVLTEELLEACGCQCSKYDFTFTYQNQEYELKQSGKNTLNLADPMEIWKIEEDGLNIKKEVKIAYPHLLYGNQGIAPYNSQIGICIVWTNRSLTQTGYILPESDCLTPTGRKITFYHEFKAGEIKGDLELTIAFYLKEQAKEIDDNETHLNNEAGVTLGEIESVSIDFNSIYMEFPIEECNSKEQPLWWVEFSQWEDPRVDLFNKENICVYLNTHYDFCPMVGESIKNIDLLVQIIATVYFLIFTRMSDEELNATKYDIGLNPNSICSIMHQFILGCNDLQWESDEKLLKSIQQNVERMLKEGED